MLFRLLLVAALSLPIAAAPVFFGDSTTHAATTKKKKKSYKRSDFTPEQREKILERARQLCRQKFGATARLQRIDYSTGTFWCWTG